MYALTRRTKLSILAALPPFLLNILHLGTHTLYPSLDVFVSLLSAPIAAPTNQPSQSWLSYGVIHFISPFFAALWLWLFASPGATSIFAWSFGLQNCLGIITHLLVPTAAPWYGDQYGYPLPQGNYSMPGSAAGLVRVDAVLGTHIYEHAFKASPLVFGAFPSLHGAFAACCFFFVARYSRRGAFVMGFYVLWQWWSTMYLRHHWRIDLLGGLAYSALAFSFFFVSLGKADRLYASGMAGKNGWQRLFEGTILEGLFERNPRGLGYASLRLDSSDGDSEEGSDVMMDGDLERSWTKSFGDVHSFREL